MMLDVGCGNSPKGDVNVDLFTEATKHRSDNSPLKTKKIPNFVKAHAEFLPFKNETFEVTFSSHVIEHVDNPFSMLREMARVTVKKGLVEIKCPHRFSTRRSGASKHHKHYFNITWFMKAAEKCGLTWMETKINCRSFPHEFMPIFKLPNEISIVFRKPLEPPQSLR